MNCRLCGAPLGGGARLGIERAPSAAQAFAASARAARQNAATLTIVQCTACGLVQSASAVVDSYRRAISAAGVSGPMREHRARQATRLGEGRAGKRVALVGCGNGYELEILATAGMAPEGIEWGGAPSGYSMRWPVHDGYPSPGATLPGAPYAAFACFNFLEHAPDPAGFLRAIASSLDANGDGVVEVPDYDQMIRDRRAFDYVADHVSYFDAGTLRSALTCGGFVVDEVESARGGENVVAWVHRDGESPAAPAHRVASVPGNSGSGITTAPLADHAVAVEAARASIAEHLSAVRACGGRAAVWGASHQALTLLATVDPTLVTGIIDSSPAKQGLFAPASGIPVVAPSAEAVAGLESVIIIASGYVDEIRTRLAALGFAGRAHVVREARVVALD